MSVQLNFNDDLDNNISNSTCILIDIKKSDYLNSLTINNQNRKNHFIGIIDGFNKTISVNIKESVNDNLNKFIVAELDEPNFNKYENKFVTKANKKINKKIIEVVDKITEDPHYVKKYVNSDDNEPKSLSEEDMLRYDINDVTEKCKQEAEHTNNLNMIARLVATVGMISCVGYINFRATDDYRYKRRYY
jgi:hypothetical protein